MDFLETFSNKFGAWYEGLFGGEAEELRPKDILRKLTSAMEENRKEGFDGKIYVPNRYILELSIDDPEERDYLLSFLDEEELASVLQRFMAQNHYHARGPLDFTIAETPPDPLNSSREKLRVRARYERGKAQSETDEFPKQSAAAPTRPVANAAKVAAPELFDDLPTVYAHDDADDEPSTIPTIAWAALGISNPDGRKSHFSITRPQVLIGRSRNAGNDIALTDDGMVSKIHARIERERDGRFVLYDLASTNGVKINGVRIDDNRLLRHGDEITIGATTLVFQAAGDELIAGPQPVPARGSGDERKPRLIGTDGTEHVAASETLIGRSITSDIVLQGPGAALRHARLLAADSATCYLEALSTEHETRVNGSRAIPGEKIALRDGDILTFGADTFDFEAGRRV